MTLRKDTPPTF